MDYKLKFKSDIENVLHKLSMVQGITYSIRRTVPRHCLKQIYFSLAYPHIIQSVILWGGTYPTFTKPIDVKGSGLNRLNQLRCEIVKYSSNHLPLVSTSITYKKLGMVKIRDVYEYNLLKFIIYTCEEHP